MTQDNPRLLPISKAAARLGVSQDTLRRWADQGLIKTVKLPSGFRRFSEEEITRKRREMGIEDEPQT